jgi:hypothetical protein
MAAGRVGGSTREIDLSSLIAALIAASNRPYQSGAGQRRGQVSWGHAARSRTDAKTESGVPRSQAALLAPSHGS